MPLDLSQLSERELRRRTLIVVNPLPGKASTVSAYHAKRDIRQGRAMLLADDSVYYLTNTTETLIQAERRLAERAQAQASGLGYDGDVSMGRIADREQLRHIPIVQGSVALGCGQRSAGCGPPR